MAETLTTEQFLAKQVESASRQADVLREYIEKACAAFDDGHPYACRAMLEEALLVDDENMHVQRIVRPEEA